jgi:hypothetical protein
VAPALDRCWHPAFIEDEFEASRVRQRPLSGTGYDHLGSIPKDRDIRKRPFANSNAGTLAVRSAANLNQSGTTSRQCPIFVLPARSFFKDLSRRIQQCQERLDCKAVR